MRPDGNCRACMVEVKGERVLAASCCRLPTQGMEVTTDNPRAVHSQKMVLELLLSDMPEERHTLHSELDHWAATLKVGKPRFARRGQSAGRSVSLRDRGQSRFLHPVHALRARLPRRAGERRHRLRVPRRAFEDRLRSRRPDGRIDLRRVRRMRAGVPDRRAHAGARRGARQARQAGALGLPVLRRRLPAHLQRQGQQDPLRRRPRRSVESQAAVREGPLRLRLRASQAAADEAAHPQARRAEARGLHDGPVEPARVLPRGDAGRKRSISPRAG